ncbi:MAG: 23S rRNA (adenine(2030)-N(6))-methyltransferase RlmJ, partial [Hyphomicrobiaceae bacterium]
MNYRHAYHAGNFADVMKHIVLMLVVESLLKKSKPFRVIDTHAGIALYDLTAEEAQRTGEWRKGIGRLTQRLMGTSQSEIPPAILRYVNLVRGYNGDGDLTHLTRYPGSPALARQLLRPQDRLLVNEMHPEDCATLKQHFRRDRQVKVLELDGWTAIKSSLPPRERRGVILVDPSFEEINEFDRLIKALTDAVSRFATGIYLLWYPLKDRIATAQFKEKLLATGIRRLMTAELVVASDEQGERLFGSGLVLHNPPYGLEGDLVNVL